jgi:hypothetical protein
MYYYQNNRRLFFSFTQLNNNIQNNKFNAPMDSSMRLNELKQRTTNTSASKSEKKTNGNDANSALRRMRSSGYVTPSKAQNKFIS